MNTTAHYIKWLILVGLNTIISVFFSVNLSLKKSAWEVNIQILLGILSFVFIYATIDKLLYKKDLKIWRQSLQHGVTISAIFYLIVPYVPILTGMLASRSIMKISHTFHFPSFIKTYLTVMLDGLILSLIALLPILVVHFIILQHDHFDEIEQDKQTMK